MDLYTKQVSDKYLRENFEEIQKTSRRNIFLQGDFQFFEFRVSGAQDNFQLYHNLGFSPNDVIITRAVGGSFEFDYDGFNDQYLTIKTTDDLYLRCFIGNMKGDEVSGSNAFATVTDDLGSSGGTGGGSVAFSSQEVIVSGSFLSNRVIVLTDVPIRNSAVVFYNGLALRSDGYSISKNYLTISNSVPLVSGDELIATYAI